MTLTEHDHLKKTDPECYWELYFWLLIPKLEEKRRMEEKMAEIKAKQGGYSNQKDIGSLPPDGLNQEQFSEIIKKEDIESGKYKLPK